ncbi:MAG: hypothetical protein GC147_08555 [Porphyrobacter sp.]|nr:hypothetical protein [Porphyrobacter sp.]
MTRGRRKKAQVREGRQPRPRLAAQGFFAPVLGIWGAALGAAVILVLPQASATALAAAAGLGGLGGFAPQLLALLAALVLGGAMFALARIAARRVRPAVDAPSLAAVAMRRVRTIDPATELGSQRLDDPVETPPFAVPADEPGEDPPAPRSLDLEEFGALPGRNAVWVEEPAVAAQDAAPAPAPADETAPARPRPSRPSAIERLRAVPPSELSLIQMVERFAAAVHEHQAAAARGERRPDPAGREAALAEALKALATLSGEMREEADDEPLRKALARLQELRGAA